MSGTDLAKQYKENEAKIAEIVAERDNFTKARDEEMRELKYHIYYDKIRALEDERDSEMDKVEKAKEEHEATAKGQIEELEKVITKVKRITYFLKLQPSERLKGWNEEKVSTYRDKYMERLGALYRDEFLDIRLLVTENDRPKNKYTLFAIGRCAFGSQPGWEESSILELPYGYGLYINDSGAGANVNCVFAFLPTIDDVKRYYAKHEGNFMRSFLDEYRKVKQEYFEVVRTYRLEEFEGIKA